MNIGSFLDTAPSCQLIHNFFIFVNVVTPVGCNGNKMFIYIFAGLLINFNEILDRIFISIISFLVNSLPYFAGICPVGGQQLPTIADESSFKYLGKCFYFKMDHSNIKLKLKERLADMLKTTSELNIKPQQKLKILRLFIHHS